MGCGQTQGFFPLFFLKVLPLHEIWGQTVTQKKNLKKTHLNTGEVIWWNALSAGTLGMLAHRALQQEILAACWKGVGLCCTKPSPIKALFLPAGILALLYNWWQPAVRLRPNSFTWAWREKWKEVRNCNKLLKEKSEGELTVNPLLGPQSLSRQMFIYEGDQSGDNWRL